MYFSIFGAEKLQKLSQQLMPVEAAVQPPVSRSQALLWALSLDWCSSQQAFISLLTDALFKYHNTNVQINGDLQLSASLSCAALRYMVIVVIVVVAEQLWSGRRATGDIN